MFFNQTVEQPDAVTAGPAFADAPWGIHPKGGTGFGVRLLLRFIEDFK